MTTRNLDALFRPSAIALVGASNEPGKVGTVLAKNLLESGFAGPVMPVNPHETAIRSTVNYRSVAELPVTPDLAVIATPPAAVPGLVAELGARGCRAAVVVTAGFGEAGSAVGAGLRQAMLDASRPHLVRIVGPNCLGFISPAAGINASFAHLTPPAGRVALVTQSGAIATTLIDWAAARGLGFSHVVSLGDMADVDFGDLLDFLALDRATRAILLYVENVTAARKFMCAGRIAARVKPVIVVKAGRTAAGAQAALSHTGALAGADHVYEAAFQRAGMLRVGELRELFEAVGTLSSGIRVEGDRLVILTNGGGLGVMAVDALERHGGRLAALSPETLAELDAELPKTWSHGNPVDILGDAAGSRYGGAVRALFARRQFDGLLVLNCPTAIADGLDAAEAVIEALRERANAPVFTSWVGETAAAAARRRFLANAIPTYETPEEGVRAFMHLADYRHNQELLREVSPTPAAIPEEARARAKAVVRAALAEGRTVLTEIEAKALLSEYAIPVVPTRVAHDPQEAARLAGGIDGPCALKILSHDITHKSDVGGVRLDLRSPAEVFRAAEEMLAAVAAKAPGARIDGFTVQPMIRRPRAHELLVGIAEDATFGPVILFGHGGTAAEVIADRVVGLPPLNPVLAGDMILRTRVASLLAGYRDRPPVDRAALIGALLRLSDIVLELPEVAELDINPLLADDAGVIALDARVVLRAQPDGEKRLAIRPYPAELAHTVVLRDGAPILVRAIRPEDEDALVAMVARSAPEDLRLRFFRSIQKFPREVAARFTQIDYDREIGLVALAEGDDALLGLAGLVCDPERTSAEFAVMVRSDMQGLGLGWALMSDILAHARREGFRRVWGDVLRENQAMLGLAEELGFSVRPDAEDAGIVRAVIDLPAGESADG